METTELNFTVRCEECGDDLSASVDITNNRIYVDIYNCPRCMTDAHARGVAETELEK